MGKRVFFVGAGTGDPRLLTLRAAEVLAESDALFHDASVHAEAIARAPAGATRRVVRPGEAVEREMVALATQGKTVVRLMAGDPFLAPTGEREIGEVARAGVPFEVVPGVAALPALGAYAGIPPFRSSDASPSVAMCAVDPGHESLQDWSRLSRATDTLVVHTEAACLGEIASSLLFYERPANTPAAIVTGLATPAQRVVMCTLQELPARGASMQGRLVLVVGEPVALRDRLRWFDARPLFGKRIGVTRAIEQAGRAAAILRERGAEPVVAPTISIRAPKDPEPLRAAVASLASRTWVAFTSANGVERAFEEIARQGLDARAFGGAKVAAIGPATAAALRAHGVAPDVVAKEFKGEGLAEEVLAQAKPGEKVLLLRAKVARDAFPDALRAAGCEVDVVTAYETEPAPPEAIAPIVAELEARTLDAILFTSSSTVTHLCDALGARAAELLARTTLASIGPITTQTAEARGLRVGVTASTYTVPGLVDALEADFLAKLQGN